MTLDNIVGIVAVIIGAILGYLASYLNNRQERKWRLDSEYRAWQREEIEKDTAAILDFVQRYVTLAHVYSEFTDSPNDPILKKIFAHTKDNAVEQLKNEKPFPISLKAGPTKSVLDELDKVTDLIVEVAINGNNPKDQNMRTLLEKLRGIEKDLYLERQNMMASTFK
jgi:hypothetical protein